MITTTDTKKCKQFDIDIYDPYQLTCKYYKLDSSFETTSSGNSCSSCYYYR